METQTTPSLYGERGAGGKYRKPVARKPPSKPYDRPPTAANNRGWLSKLVDPACRLLTDGATRILPSFLYKPPAALPPPSNANNSDDRGSEVEPTKKDDAKCASSHAAPEGTPSEVPDNLNITSEPDELGKGEVNNSSGDYELSRIEQLIEGKTFSRDEINHLKEILNSRILEVSDGEHEGKKEMTIAAGENEGIVLARNGEQEDNNKAILRTPLPQSNVGDEIGASPIDIARAYMGRRTLGQDIGPYSDLPKAEYVSNSLIPSPSPKAPACWPGSVVPDQRSYDTPLSQRGRYGLHDFPRTPYSRTIYSNSRTKLIRSQADSRFASGSSNFFQQSQTPIYGQAKTRADVLHDGFGSAGPIRRTRNKFGSEARSRGAIFSKPSTQTASVVGTPNVSKGFLPTLERNLEPGENSNSSKNQPEYSGTRRSEESNMLLTPSTSQAVRRILENLDRTKPTPKEKAAELKLATSWRKPASSEISDNSFEATTSFPKFGDKKTDLVLYGRKNPDVQGKSSEITVEAKSAVESRVSVYNLNGDSGMKNNFSAESSSGVKSTPNFQVQSSHEKAFVGINNGQKERDGHTRVHDQTNAQNFSFVPKASSFELPKKPPTQPTAKPNRPSIAITKPDLGRVVSSDNGFGFTFPVSASFGVLSEPPTPSILPSSSPSKSSLPTLGSEVPSYSFGAKRSSSPLVFAFPATSSAVTNSDTSEPKFKFGSDNKSRLSFKSTGNGVVSV